MIAVGLNDEAMPLLGDKVSEKSTQLSLRAWMKMYLGLLHKEESRPRFNKAINKNREDLAYPVAYVDQIYFLLLTRKPDSKLKGSRFVAGEPMHYYPVEQTCGLTEG